MHLLNCAHKLATLEKLLVKYFPESLKVYGTVFHINRGNPFNLELLVDSWPDFRTVITRPPLQERTDDLDSYTNTYFMYSRDMEGLREILRTSDVVDWSQALQIQGLQNSLDEVIRSTADIKMSKVEAVKRLLYVKEDSLKRCHHNGPPATSEKKAVSPPIIRFVKRGQQHEFRFSSLSPSHAELLNKGWALGGNEKSLRYIERCIRLLPSGGFMNSSGNPVSVGLMDESAELRMAYTLPEYRGFGLYLNLVKAFMDSMPQQDLPLYIHMAADNKKAIGPSEKSGFRNAHCGWYQWTCQPF